MAEANWRSQIADARDAFGVCREKGDDAATALAGYSLSLLCLEEGLNRGDAQALREAADYGALSLKHVPDDESALAASIHGVIGTALCKIYEVNGSSHVLTEGLTHLRSAHETAQRLGKGELLQAASRNLIVALVRTGEQLGDLSLLREGYSLAAPLLDRHGNGKSVDDFILINAMAVAMLRIGLYGADPAMVVEATKTLRQLLGNPMLSIEGRNQTKQNLCAALVAQARQKRTREAYQEVLVLLDSVDDRVIRDELTAYFAHYRSQVSSELCSLTGDVEAGKAALATLSRLAEWHSSNSFRQLEVLHSMAQVHFQLGKFGSRPESSFRAAIHAVERALELAAQGARTIDSRQHRLLADLGAYKHALGLTIRSRQLVDEAESAFRDALELVSPSKTPSLYIAIARGLFTLLFLEEKWTSALQVFSAIEGAWDRVVADPALSGAIHEQGTRELAGQHTRAAWAQMKIGELNAAVLALDRGRARQLQIALSVSRKSAVSEVDCDEAIVRARTAVADAISSGSDALCKDTWDKYLSIRRRKGLDNQLDILTWVSATARVPAGGAIVQIVATEKGVAAFVLRDGDASVHVIHYPDSLRTALSRFIRGAQDDGDWLTAYSRFVNRHKGEGAGGGVLGRGRASSAYRSWSGMVERTCRLLGQSLVEEIDLRLRNLGLEEGAEVVLCPPGALASLPLCSAYLRDGSTFGSHWSASLAPCISTLPIGSYLGMQHRVIVIPPPFNYAAECRELPFAVREAQLVGNHFAPEAHVYFARDQATVKNVTEAVGKATVLHAACHGVFDRELPQSSGLELADGQRLTPNRLRQGSGSKHVTRLVVLSSCESAIAGLAEEPDEFIGLPVSFLRAGAMAVIGTLWAVYDDTAMLVCDRFYANYLDERGCEKMAPARALSLAVAWIRNVTIRDLIRLGYFTATEAVKLFARTDRASRRLRGLALADRTLFEGHAKNEPNDRLDILLDTCPYASQAEWGGFVTFGR